MNTQPSTTQPRTYQIKLQGTLDAKWSDWFDGFQITPLATGETLMTGPIADQAALHGLLTKIRDIGLPLLSINALPDEA